jgi:hypothetical protein
MYFWFLVTTQRGEVFLVLSSTELVLWTVQIVWMCAAGTILVRNSRQEQCCTHSVRRCT